MTRAGWVITPRGYRREVSPWERRDVTVCIAAACLDKDQDKNEGTYRIVLCTDWRVSGVLGSADTKLKIRSLRKGGGV
jgi:hypothetical protein